MYAISTHLRSAQSALDTAAAAERVIGYRGNRDGSYPDATSPLTWDSRTGENIRWKTLLPNWCYGTPLIVGQKIFVMSASGWILIRSMYHLWCIGKEGHSK